MTTRLLQVDEITWPQERIALLDRVTLEQFESLGVRFRAGTDASGPHRYAWVVVDGGEEIGLRYRPGSGDPGVEIRAARRDDRSPRDMLQLLLEAAALDEGAVRWVADQWPP